jgi:predicted nucleic acid-binding protein
MVIVDTSVLIDYFGDYSNWQTEWLDRHINTERLGITSLVLTEVLQGARGSKQFLLLASALDQFTIFETGSRELALRSAVNYRFLRGLGFTIRSTIDCLIATFCIEEGHTLLSKDSDFDHFAKHLGLLVVDPSASLPN